MDGYNPLIEAFVDYKSNHFCPAINETASKYGLHIRRVPSDNKSQIQTEFELNIGGMVCGVKIDFLRDEQAHIRFLENDTQYKGQIKEKKVPKLTTIYTRGNETVKKFADDVKHLIEDKEQSKYYYSGMSVEVI